MDAMSSLEAVEFLRREECASIKKFLNIPKVLPGFYAWLKEKKQQERNDRVGDLARDTKVDSCWPRRNSFNAIWSYLNSINNRATGVDESFIAAWIEYAEKSGLA